MNKEEEEAQELFLKEQKKQQEKFGKLQQAHEEAQKKLAAAQKELAKSRGLGDSIKKITDFLHIPQCGGCKERQEMLNKAFPYKEK